MNKPNKLKLNITYVPISEIHPNKYNPKILSPKAAKDLRESIEKFGPVDPLILNSAPQRKNIIIGGHQRYSIYRELGMKTAPCVYVEISDLELEKELCIRLSKNVAEFEWGLLSDFGEDFLKSVGFESEALDKVFGIDEHPEEFDLAKELKKLQIERIETKKGDTWQIGPHRIRCGDSMDEKDVLELMDGEKADLCLTDPPYILSYLTGKKRHGKATEGFGLKRDRKYLGTDSLPENFTDLWMANVAKVQKPDFSIIVFENPKNLRTIWNSLEVHWKYRNTIVWHLPNRVQGFAAKYKFFNKHDIALVGTGGNVSLNLELEDEFLQNEYENALFATSGKPHWENYEKGKKICPTDFVEHIAADEKSSGQGIIFGTKPTEILIPYVKVLTKRDDLVIEPFCGSGSTVVAAHKLGRRCYAMEKSEVYTEVAKRRVEKLTGIKAIKIHDSK